MPRQTQDKHKEMLQKEAIVQVNHGPTVDLYHRWTCKDN
eukprot:COSAG06_NODE_71106_length_187_cov_140.375000_1_plen_38_part_01